LVDADRTALAAAMDRLVPPVDDLQGAGSMGLAEQVEKRAGRSSRLRSALVAVLDALSLDPTSHAAGGYSGLDGERQDEALRTVEASMSDRFAVFLQLVYTVYYMEIAVHKRTGWHGRPPQPEGYEVPTFDESVLEQVQQREPFWREV
jgi:hypothetical protein